MGRLRATVDDARAELSSREAAAVFGVATVFDAAAIGQGEDVLAALVAGGNPAAAGAVIEVMLGPLAAVGGVAAVIDAGVVHTFGANRALVGAGRPSGATIETLGQRAAGLGGAILAAAAVVDTPVEDLLRQSPTGPLTVSRGVEIRSVLTRQALRSASGSDQGQCEEGEYGDLETGQLGAHG